MITLSKICEEISHRATFSFQFEVPNYFNNSACYFPRRMLHPSPYASCAKTQDFTVCQRQLLTSDGSSDKSQFWDVYAFKDKKLDFRVTGRNLLSLCRDRIRGSETL